MALDQFVQGLARSPLGNLPALMQQKQALDRQKMIDKQREQIAQREREREMVRLETLNKLDQQISMAKTDQEREQLLGQAAMGLNSMGFPDSAEFYQSERDSMIEQRQGLADLKLKQDKMKQDMNLAKMRETGLDRRARMQEAGQDRRAIRKERGLQERHLDDLLQKERQFDAEQRIRESANERSEEQHMQAMERGALELDQAYVDRANNETKMANTRIAQAWHDLTNGGTIEGFHQASDVINSKVQQYAGLFQDKLGLPDHRIPMAMDVIPGDGGQPLVAFEIQNTKTGTTGPMTRNGSASAADRVVAIPLSSFNNMMRSELGLQHAHDEIRENMENLYRESGMMAAMPEGRKEQQVAVTDLATQAYDFSGDIRVGEKIAAIMLNSDLPEVQKFWNAKTIKQKSMARDEIISLVAPYAKEAMMEPSLKSVTPKKQKTASRDDPRAVMPIRVRDRYTENPIDPAYFP